MGSSIDYADRWSASAIYPAGDARAVSRQQTMFVVGRIVTPRRECVCLVRNISSAGVGVEHEGELPIETEVTIETRTMWPTRAIVRWSTGNAAGLEFLEPPRTLSAATLAAQGQLCTPRSPRFALTCDAQLTIGDLRVSARTSDIALGGLKLTNLASDLPTVAARVELHDLGRVIAGRIRWYCAASAGFQFITPLTSHDLAVMLDPSQRAVQ